MDETTFELLHNYAKEIGYGESSIPETPYGALSFLVQLIDSHRTLRTERLKSNAERLEEFDKIRKTVRDMEMDSTWVKWETLRHMTINQLAEAIGIEK